MAVSEKEIKKSLSLIFSDIALVSLGKSQQTLMPDDRQLGLCVAFGHTSHHITALNGCGVHTAESHEMKDQSIDNLEREGVLLLEKGLDKDVGSATSLGTVGRFLSRNIAKALESCRGMKNRDRYSDQDS